MPIEFNGTISTNGTATNKCTSYEKKWTPTLTLHHTQKIKSIHIIDLNIKAKTVELTKKNIREKLCEIGVGKDFLDRKHKMYKSSKNVVTWTSLKFKISVFKATVKEM